MGIVKTMVNITMSLLHLLHHSPASRRKAVRVFGSRPLMEDQRSDQHRTFQSKVGQTQVTHRKDCEISVVFVPSYTLIRLQ